MGRSILAVIVSYIVMAVIIMALFMGMWFGLGMDRLLEPGSFKGKLWFSVAVPALTFGAAVFGGWLCAKIARGNPKPVLVLAAIVLFLGLGMAYFTLQKPFPADPRPADMTVLKLMEIGREPTWVAISNPIIGAAGVLIGGLLLCGCGTARGPRNT